MSDLEEVYYYNTSRNIAYWGKDLEVLSFMTEEELTEMFMAIIKALTRKWGTIDPFTPQREEESIVEKTEVDIEQELDVASSEEVVNRTNNTPRSRVFTHKPFRWVRDSNTYVTDGVGLTLEEVQDRIRRDFNWYPTTAGIIARAYKLGLRVSKGVIIE